MFSLTTLTEQGEAGLEEMNRLIDCATSKLLITQSDCSVGMQAVLLGRDGWRLSQTAREREEGGVRVIFRANTYETPVYSTSAINA